MYVWSSQKLSGAPRSVILLFVFEVLHFGSVILRCVLNMLHRKVAIFRVCVCVSEVVVLLVFLKVVFQKARVFFRRGGLAAPVGVINGFSIISKSEPYNARRMFRE